MYSQLPVRDRFCPCLNIPEEKKTSLSVTIQEEVGLKNLKSANQTENPQTIPMLGFATAVLCVRDVVKSLADLSYEMKFKNRNRLGGGANGGNWRELCEGNRSCATGAMRCCCSSEGHPVIWSLIERPRASPPGAQRWPCRDPA